MNLRQPLWLFLFIVSALVVGCSNTVAPAPSTANLEIINESSAKIVTIGIESSAGSQGGQNADNSPLSKGDRLYFDIQGTNSFTVKLYPGTGQSKGNPLASQTILWDFSKGMLTLRIVDNGTSVAIVKSVP